MANVSLKVLVTGATGYQGGAVARALLERGHHVRAFTRSVDGPGAEQLRKLGAELVIGSFDDQESLVRAAHGCDAVFAMSPSDASVEPEIRQARAIVDAARRAATRHLVYASVAHADRETGVPHFDSKLQVERYIRSLDLPYTIIGPVFFMENFLRHWWLPGLRAGKLVIAMSKERKLQQIAVADIARFTALIFERREPFLGRRIDIASDEISVNEAAVMLARASGKPIEYVQLPIEAVRAGSDGMARMFEWFEHVGFAVDIARLRADHPEVGWQSFEQWLGAQDWRLLEP